MLSTALVLKTTQELKVREWKLLCSASSIILQPHREFELSYDIILDQDNNNVIIVCDVPGIGESTWDGNLGEESKSGKEKVEEEEDSSNTRSKVHRSTNQGNFVEAEVKSSQTTDLSHLTLLSNTSSIELEVKIFRRLWYIVNQSENEVKYYQRDSDAKYEYERAAAQGKTFRIPLPRNCKEEITDMLLLDGVMTVVIPLFKKSVGKVKFVAAKSKINGETQKDN